MALHQGSGEIVFEFASNITSFTVQGWSGANGTGESGVTMSSINFPLEGNIPTTTGSPAPEASTWAMMLLGFAGKLYALLGPQPQDECLDGVSFQNRLQKGRLGHGLFLCLASTHLDNQVILRPLCFPFSIIDALRREQNASSGGGRSLPCPWLRRRREKLVARHTPPGSPGRVWRPTFPPMWGNRCARRGWLSEDPGRTQHLTLAKQRALIRVESMGGFTHAVRGLRADLAEHPLPSWAS